MKRTNAGYTLIASRAVLAFSVSIVISNAEACTSASGVSDAACVRWASITGDILEDACVVATLDVQRVESALADLRRPREPGAPIWSAAYLEGARQEAVARQTRACSAHAAELR